MNEKHYQLFYKTCEISSWIRCNTCRTYFGECGSMPYVHFLSLYDFNLFISKHEDIVSQFEKLQQQKKSPFLNLGFIFVDMSSCIIN